MAARSWIVKITVDDSWIADGFDLTAERAHDMVCSDLSHAYPHEVVTEILEAPDPATIKALQEGRSWFA